MVPKSDDQWRLILDLSSLNNFIATPSFQMSNLAEAQKLIHKDDWMCTLDLEKAYWHVPIHPQSRKFLCFRFQNSGYVFNVLPFGLSVAPYWFTRIMVPFLNVLHSEGIKVLSYIDDFLISAPEVDIGNHLTRVSLISNAGFLIGDKSARSPSRLVKFLGVNLQTPNMVSSIPEGKQDHIKDFALKLAAKPRISRRSLESFVGLLNYFSNHTYLLRQKMWKIISIMNMESSAARRDKKIRFPPHLYSIFRQIDRLDLSVPRSFRTPSKWEEITVDASLLGWGATFHSLEISGHWESVWKKRSINARELLTCLIALDHWGISLKNKAVLIHTDSRTAAAVIRRRGSPRSILLTEIMERIEMKCYNLNILLSAKHVAGSLNVAADALSRSSPRPSEWSLAQPIFNKICSLWGTPEVDLCATAQNAKVSTFISPLPTDHLQDCLTTSWNQWSHLYAFPPSKLMPKFLSKTQFLKDHQKLILIFPWWPKRPWFACLMKIADPPFIPLNLRHQDLSQIVQGEIFYHPNPSILALHAVLLSGASLHHKDGLHLA